jgi:hypothetical protein
MYGIITYNSKTLYGIITYILNLGRAITQAISRWVTNAAARVRDRVWSSGIYGGQGGAREGFLQILELPLPIFIPPNSPSSLSPRAGTIG